MRLLCKHRVLYEDSQYLPGDTIPDIDKDFALFVESTGAGQILSDPPEGKEISQERQEREDPPKTQESEGDQGDNAPGDTLEKLKALTIPVLKEKADGLEISYSKSIRKMDLIEKILKA